jgi:hypothetical protein
VDAAAPVREGGIVKRAQSLGMGNDVHLIVAVEVAADFKVTEVRECIDGCSVNILIVAREGEVETGL